MPLLSTRGGLSSRGFGQLNGGVGLTLRTFTFPAGSSTFTVPATTNLLVSAVGAGADGSPGGTSTSEIGSQITFVDSNNTTFPGGFATTYDALFQELNSAIAAFNQGGTVYYSGKRLTVFADNLCNITQQFNANRPNIVPNTAYAQLGNNAPTSGPVTYASAVGKAYFYTVIATQQTTFGPSTGAATTGFGLTFPGGAGGPSTTTTFNNVAVVPNQTYVITNNKSLTITYFS